MPRGIPKQIAKGTPLFYMVDPGELEGLDDWAEWLDALRNGPCGIEEADGRLHLVEIRQLVGRLSGGIRIEVYPDEHAPPHFHVRAPSLNASLAIEDCRVLKGTVSGADLRTIRYWHAHAKPDLIRCWNETRPGDCTVGCFRG